MSITINIIKAREMQRDIIRKERAPLLSALDIEAMKSIGNQTFLAEIEAKKQALRDAPSSQLIENASTPEELKGLTLIEILKRSGQ